MHFFCDGGASSVLEDSKRFTGAAFLCTPYALWFSVLASCTAIALASMQVSVRYFLAFTKKALFLEIPNNRI